MAGGADALAAVPLFAERMMKPQTQLMLALSRCFLAPTEAETARAILATLVEDLDALCRAGRINAASTLGELAQALARFSTPQELLIHYSHLFLPPGGATSLNLTMHLEGSLNGGAMDGLEAALTRHGLARAEFFHDLPDHLASVLEALACIGEAASEPEDVARFARAFLLPALPRLAAQVAADDPGSPYLALLHLTQVALAWCAGPQVRDRRRERSWKRADPEIGLWRECQTCHRPYAREKELRIMAKALEEAGLPSTHLDFCPDCREPGGSWLGRGREAGASLISR